MVLGATVVNGMVDIKGFYDHIDLGRLVEYAVEWGFPPQVLVMSLLRGPGPEDLGDGAMDVREALCAEALGPYGRKTRQPQGQAVVVLDAGGHARL